MKVHYPKLYNMAHLLSLNVFTASKGSNNYILFTLFYTIGALPHLGIPLIIGPYSLVNSFIPFQAIV